jgi:hypothetical protein
LGAACAGLAPTADVIIVDDNLIQSRGANKAGARPNRFGRNGRR